eukprot:gnl/TRDRNA2_/TRDRNA2_127396_c0_seq1.p1 gnl/TRDRNA2_/TRDRNA2_127396_c0~~gnl/TRDRNA2_/TRDRNA2_127396_c0_seq1.p1  ORF type:complete len:213 (-),score=34.75 gnl/TRDRNA2_/TRDRNA2_127396_c0_seq1:118-756(-)
MQQSRGGRTRGPLPPLEAPPVPQIASSALRRDSLTASSSREQTPHLSQTPTTRSTGSLSSAYLRADVDVSRSTSASSHQSWPPVASSNSEVLGRPANVGGGGYPVGQEQPPQVDDVVRALLPIVKRAMVSKNQAVFKTSIDSVTRIAKMFGQDAIDRHVETLAEALERQCAAGARNDEARAAEILATLTSLCSETRADALRRRFPKYAAAGS